MLHGNHRYAHGKMWTLWHIQLLIGHEHKHLNVHQSLKTQCYIRQAYFKIEYILTASAKLKYEKGEIKKETTTIWTPRHKQLLIRHANTHLDVHLSLGTQCYIRRQVQN